MNGTLATGLSVRSRWWRRGRDGPSQDREGLPGAVLCRLGPARAVIGQDLLTVGMRRRGVAGWPAVPAPPPTRCPGSPGRSPSAWRFHLCDRRSNEIAAADGSIASGFAGWGGASSGGQVSRSLFDVLDRLAGNRGQEL